ncbi:alpha glucosidase [Umbelopsis sp. AD052]|nr:alpha glucosidase [Umbelopsis sp. AD052]
MAKYSSILVAILLSFTVVQAELPAAAPGIVVDSSVSHNAAGYHVNGHAQKTKTGLHLPLVLNSGKTDLYGKAINKLSVDVDFETSDRLHVRIADTAGKQYLVPDSPLGLVRPKTKKAASHPNYSFHYTDKPFSFKVTRNSDKEVLFDTTGQPLVFEDQYLELTTKVPDNANLYGFGEVTGAYRRNNHANVTTLWARDVADPFYQNQYGSHPAYTEIRNGKAHGNLLLNAHGMDIFTMTGRITYKVIGGVLDFYFFVPEPATPNAVVSSYTDLVGKSIMPAHWMLGWHQCRYGYHNISEVDGVVESYRENKIPLETMWTDIDYMDRTKDFTFDPINFPISKVKALTSKLHSRQQRYVVMIDPAISTNTSYEPYSRGHNLDVFMKLNDYKTELQGQVWPGYTAFPDWWHPNVQKYWDYEVTNFMKSIELDGVWIDMNEPSSFCLGSCGTGKRNESPEFWWNLPADDYVKLHAEWEANLNALGTGVPGDSRNLLYPPYVINNGAGNLSEKTAPTTALHYGKVPHYDVHNLYGHAESHVTNKAIQKYRPGERVFLLTRSQFPGTGKNAGHWTGDNFSQWNYLKVSIAAVLQMQQMGIAFSGSDVCGFNGDTNMQLCARWQALGSLYPFARNHNGIGQVSQEPYRWPEVAEATRLALAARYAMMPYLYTLFEEANTVGTGVWRPLIFEYPKDDRFLAEDVQFLIGDSVLVSPIVVENATSIHAKFPTGVWYDWYNGKAVNGPTSKTIEAPLTHIPLHVRGGAILPLKAPKMTIDATYATPYELLVALDTSGKASGRLYIDDGHSIEQQKTSDIDFKFAKGKLSASGKFHYHEQTKLEKIAVLGSSYKSVKFNGKSYSVRKDSTTGAYVAQGFKIDLTKPFSVEFH